ncbi:GABA transporter 1 [Vitis vinifera]|uniref:GABA transporter 1 n=1 Tax=Vitis vinifera TaxID=29760 RepID=A0A438KFM1_VITVI|nr:GABA transporter 1 [Vitis vinifera]
MGVFNTGSTAADEGEEAAAPQQQKDLDAGALFVLKSKGSWVHCGYHLTTSIVAPPLLSLPYAFTFLGWAAGILCLVVGALVTFYSYNLISLVLEHNANMGRRHLRFRDMAHDILGMNLYLWAMTIPCSTPPTPSALPAFVAYRYPYHGQEGGPRWGQYYVGPIQFLVCYGAVVASTLLGGQCLKTIYLLSHPDGSMKLFEFVIIFGGLMLILAQLPSFHSLRHINMVSLVLCLAYSACATGGSIYIGNSSKGPKKDYSVNGDAEDRLFGVFNAIAIIATTFGNGIIPEIQVCGNAGTTSEGEDVQGTVHLLYSGYGDFLQCRHFWLLGIRQPIRQSHLEQLLDNGKALVPKWFILMSNMFTIIQLSAVGVVYLQPTNEVLEKTFGDPTSGEFSARNVIPRVIARSLSVVSATTIAAMLPFFGDINSVIGAFGFMPLDFVLPVVFFNLTFKPSKRSLLFWVNVTIAVVFSALGVIAAVAAVRQISLDAKNYRLFANL